MSVDRLHGTWIDTHPELTDDERRHVASLMAAAAVSTGHEDDLGAVLVALGLLDHGAVQQCGHPMSDMRHDERHRLYCVTCRDARVLPVAVGPCQAPQPGTPAGARWHWRRGERCASCGAAATRYSAERKARRREVAA